MKEKVQTAIDIFDQIKYALLLFLACGLGGIVGNGCNLWISYFWRTYFSQFPMLAMALIVYPLIWAISLLITFGVIRFYFMRTVPNEYLPSEESNLWLRSALQLILPGEFIRFLICLFTCTSFNTARMLALLPSDLFRLIYLQLLNRRSEIAEIGRYTLQDYAVFSLLYLLCFALHLGVILTLHRRFWKIGQEEREDLFLRN